MSSFHVLVTEDEPFTLSLISAYLDSAGFQVSRASNAYETLQTIENEKIDLLVLDLSLPDENGLALLRQIRMNSMLPIIISTFSDDDSYRDAALELKANDYLVKPFEPERLAQAIWRCLNDQNTTDNQVTDGKIPVGSMLLDVRTRYLIDSSGGKHSLAPMEARLLQALARRPGEILSRAQLLDASYAEPDASERMIDVIISRLRQKLKIAGTECCRILAVPKVGYKFDISES